MEPMTQTTGIPANITTATPTNSIDTKSILHVQLMSKSTGVAALLALLFGGFGLLYASIPVGIVCSIIEIVFLLVVFFTAGVGLLLYIPWHILCVIIAIVLVGGHNKRLLNKL